MKIILAAGGSGGHIFPAIAVREKLISSGVSSVYFIASKRALDRNILCEYGADAYFLSVNPMPLDRNVLKWIRFSFKFGLDLLRALILINRLGCEKIVGFGGYSSGAIVLAGKLLRKKTILHEQNYVPGRANKILSGISDKVALTFPGSEKFFPREKDRMVNTGNPIREHILHCGRQEAVKNLGLKSECFNILVMGGSQGSSFLNKTLSRAIVRSKKSFPERVQVIHLTGKSDYQWVKNFYEEEGFPAKVVSFLDSIEYAYAAADLAVSRSGAAAIFELACYSVPMILVPYPHHKNNQRHNALYFQQRGAAIVEEEKTLTEEKFLETILSLLADPHKITDMAEKARELSTPEAAANLAAEIIEV